MNSMNFIQEPVTSSPHSQETRIKSFILSDLETMELESLARSAGYTEDEIYQMTGKPLKELPLFVSDIDEFINQFEDVPF